MSRGNKLAQSLFGQIRKFNNAMEVTRQAFEHLGLGQLSLIVTYTDGITVVTIAGPWEATPESPFMGYYTPAVRPDQIYELYNKLIGRVNTWIAAEHNYCTSVAQEVKNTPLPPGCFTFVQNFD